MSETVLPLSARLIPHGALFAVYCAQCRRTVVARREFPGGLTTCPKCGELV